MQMKKKKHTKCKGKSLVSNPADKGRKCEELWVRNNPNRCEVLSGRGARLTDLLLLFDLLLGRERNGEEGVFFSSPASC